MKIKFIQKFIDKLRKKNNKILKIADTQVLKYKENNVKILTPEETLKKIIKDKCSVCRFGDGEFNLIFNEKMVFEKPSKKMAEKLLKIFNSNHQNLLIGIFNSLYRQPENMRDPNSSWFVNYKKEYLNKITTLIDLEKTYCSAEISVMHNIMDDNYDFEKYYSFIREIWQDRDVVLVHGKNIFKGFQFDIFDNVKSIQYIETPNKEAFKHYKKIYKQILSYPKKSLILLILGPTATILAHDLHLVGYQAIDMGHVAKDYDWYKRGKSIGSNLQNAVEFYGIDGE